MDTRLTVLPAVLLMISYAVITYLPFQGSPCKLPGVTLQFQVWRLLCAVVITLAILIGVPMWNWTRQLWKSAGKGGIGTASAGMLAVVAFGAWLFNSREVYAFPGYPEWQTDLPQAVMGSLILICFAMFALPCAVWMTISREYFRRLAEGPRAPLDAAAEFRRMREQAQLMGTLCAVGIASSTLPLGAWRRLVLGAGKDLAGSFPPEFVVLFGLYWSFSLACGYLPVYLSVTKSGQAIRDAIAAPVPEGWIKFSDWQKQRLEIEAYLGLGGNPLDNLRAVFAVLAPLVGAVLSIMIGS